MGKIVDDFEARLREREDALGLHHPTANASAPTPIHRGEPPTVTPEATPEVAQPRDAWGNTILDAPGSLGQYRIERVVPWRSEPVILRVCGEATSDKHLLWWEFDAGERRMVCRLCWSASRKGMTAHV